MQTLIISIRQSHGSFFFFFKKKHLTGNVRDLRLFYFFFLNEVRGGEGRKLNESSNSYPSFIFLNLIFLFVSWKGGAERGGRETANRLRRPIL